MITWEVDEEIERSGEAKSEGGEDEIQKERILDVSWPNRFDSRGHKSENTD